MRRIALDLHRALRHRAVRARQRLHRHQHAARVRAVVRAHRMHHLPFFILPKSPYEIVALRVTFSAAPAPGRNRSPKETTSYRDIAKTCTVCAVVIYHRRVVCVPYRICVLALKLHYMHDSGKAFATEHTPEPARSSLNRVSQVLVVRLKRKAPGMHNGNAEAPQVSGHPSRMALFLPPASGRSRALRTFRRASAPKRKQPRNAKRQRYHHEGSRAREDPGTRDDARRTQTEIKRDWPRRSCQINHACRRHPAFSGCLVAPKHAGRHAEHRGHDDERCLQRVVRGSVFPVQQVGNRPDRPACAKYSLNQKVAEQYQSKSTHRSRQPPACNAKSNLCPPRQQVRSGAQRNTLQTRQGSFPVLIPRSSPVCRNRPNPRA